jgi:hypothetical protein
MIHGTGEESNNSAIEIPMPIELPSFEVIVTLLGPKTRAAVIIPGPNTLSQFLNRVASGLDEAVPSVCINV